MRIEKRKPGLKISPGNSVNEDVVCLGVLNRNIDFWLLIGCNVERFKGNRL